LSRAARGGLPNDLAHESKFQTLTRLGFLARGILYITIALLAVRTGRSEDMTGALEHLSRGAGAWLLGLMAAGMATYGLWRWADAVFGIEHPENEGQAYAKRAAAVVIGAIYLYLAYVAVKLLTSGTQGSGGGGSLLPSSGLFLGAAALVMLASAASQLVTAFKASFMERLNGPAQADWVKWLGRLGYAARGIVFLTVAFLLGRAALEGGSSKVGGVEQALDVFSGTSAVAIAVGLGLFGAFSIVEARYRRIHRPPVEHVEANIREKAGI
jgi:uncharacterized membrane protein YidH (DUF202 family)